MKIGRLADEDFLHRLANLKFIFKGRRQGKFVGAHYSPRAGVSLEFADYRPYFAGDDFRYVDWSVYGRSDRLLIKIFTREVDLPLYLILDLSGSMEVGEPSKAWYATRLAAALSYMGLRTMNRVGIYPFTDRLAIGLPPRQGMKHLFHIFRYLETIEPGGQTALDSTLNEFVQQTTESGLVFIISDLLFSGGYQRGLSHLLYRGDQVVILQVLAPEDIVPQMSGEAEIKGVEEEGYLDLTVGSQAIATYRNRLIIHNEAIHTFCASRGITYLQIPTDLALEEVIHHKLRVERVIR
jgi:uncharacterized protein (DUF58 family)